MSGVGAFPTVVTSVCVGIFWPSAVATALAVASLKLVSVITSIPCAESLAFA